MENDSIATPFSARVCREQDAPGLVSEHIYVTKGTIPYTLGCEPEPRATLPGYDSGVMCLLLGMFMLLAYNFRHYSTFLKNFGADLVSVRRREGTFDVRTASETGVQLSLMFMACLSEGVIINSILPSGVSASVMGGVFAVIGGLTLVAAFYYVWQIAAYATVGYIFTDRVSARMWMKGFNASQALLAMLLVIPALVVLFNPGTASAVVILALIFYASTRFLFICKGFRLFYDNFSSLIYFILYLCSLEIVPLVLLYRAARLFDTSVLHP